MRAYIVALAVIGFGFSGAYGEQVLEVAGGDEARVNVPISVPYSAESSSLGWSLVDASGGAHPATALDGNLVAVLGTVPAGAATRYTLKEVAKQNRVVIEKRDEEMVLDVRIDGELFTAYHYGSDIKKPFLWPVNAEGGVAVTRDWPTGEAVRSRDHPHHVSLWTAYGDVNGADSWSNRGYQMTDEVTWGSGAALGWIKASNVWENREHEAVIRESREYRFYTTPAAKRMIDVRVTFDAVYGDAKFGDTKEGGLVSVRMADVLCEKGGNGTITTSTGATGARATWGKPAAWCDYSGTIEGAGARGLTIFGHPTNMRHPTSWHVRDYGLMGANCFGYSYFTNGKENGDYTLKANDSVTFNYRVYVHSGDVKDAKVAEHFEDYATPPAAAWVE